ncbi:acyltransferase [bacterium]|nr:acyltransferase [bacterium]
MGSDHFRETWGKYKHFFKNNKLSTFVYTYKTSRTEFNDCICHTNGKNPLTLLFKHLKYGLVYFSQHLPWSTPKVFMLRLFGATIGEKVYISQKVFIDPLYPELLTIGDNVLIGLGVKMYFHEITNKYFRIGRIRIGNNTIIGADASIRCGITIGENVFISANAPVYKNIPANHNFILNAPLITLCSPKED